MPKMGRPPKKKTLLFREFCRDIITRPDVLERLEAEALVNPVFALRLAEFGIGRPFQAVHVTTGDRDDGLYISEFSDGTEVKPLSNSTPTGLPN